MGDAPGGGGAVLRGVGVSPGIAIGRALVLEGPNLAIFRLDLDRAEAEKEVARFRRAVRRAWSQLRGLRDRVRSEVGETYARVFEAQILILRDRALHRETAALIRRERVNAEWALRTVVGSHAQAFAQLGDPEFKERGTDIQDVEARLQAILLGSTRRHDLSELAADVVVISHSLSPSDAASLNRERVIGLAIDGGGPTSHTAIIASALGIPAVAGLRDVSVRLRTGDRVALDGSEGVLLANPAEEELGLWRERQARLAQRDLNLQRLRDQPAVTPDGVRVRLRANIELPEEMLAAQRFGAEGVGLYRSEFLYLGEGRLPDEERHYRVYRDMAEQARPHEVVIRTLDLGGELHASTILDRREGNPVLGLRAIRLCLKRQDLFKTQLRGILRAAVHGKISLMFPMVSALEELRQARAIVDAVRRDLAREGVPFEPEVPLGTMIEVPAAALIAERLAPEVDFFSVGTNDLIQYVLAIDRGNELVSYLYQPLHPAVLGLLRRVVEAAERLGRRVSVCGEMAANPLSAAVLIGLGITDLSMRPVSIPAVKQVVRGLPFREARAIVDEAMRLDTAEEIESAVRRRLEAVVPAEKAFVLGTAR
jgi:phosphotransferase system enzyme I (PtsI)